MICLFVQDRCATYPAGVAVCCAAHAGLLAVSVVLCGPTVLLSRPNMHRAANGNRKHSSYCCSCPHSTTLERVSAPHRSTSCFSPNPRFICSVFLVVQKVLPYSLKVSGAQSRQLLLRAIQVSRGGVLGYVASDETLCGYVHVPAIVKDALHNSLPPLLGICCSAWCG